MVLNNLYKQTQLQDTFGMNMVALVDGQPRVLNLKQMLEAFISHRREVVTRRTVFELRKARERGHILEGLAVALSNVDEVIELIKKRAVAGRRQARADGATRWRSELVERDARSASGGRAVPARGPAPRNSACTRGRATACRTRRRRRILEMRLQRLTGLEQDKIVDEYSEVMTTIADLLDILAKPERITAIIGDELTADQGAVRRQAPQRDRQPTPRTSRSRT